MAVNCQGHSVRDHTSQAGLSATSSCLALLLDRNLKQLQEKPPRKLQMARPGPHDGKDEGTEGDGRHACVTHTWCRGLPLGAQGLTSPLSSSSQRPDYPWVAVILLMKPRAVISTLSTWDIIPDSSPFPCPKNKQLSNFENRWNIT